MSLLLHGDCLELMKDLDDNSVDLIFTDLPYGQVSCEWDKKIDFSKMWEEFMRIKKERTPIFFCCSTKFGVEIINSAPKKCPFRYDIVWVKSAPCGFLCARKMPMKKHEMLYVFYEKLPFYDLSSHQHKFIKAVPTSVQKETYTGVWGTLPKTGASKEAHSTQYDPPLPNSILEISSQRGKHSTQKPTDLMKWVLKYYSREGDVVLDPTMGSGSTGVACKEMNRNFIGMEMNPEIFQVASERLEC